MPSEFLRGTSAASIVILVYLEAQTTEIYKIYQDPQDP